jgi:hypothetical protein
MVSILQLIVAVSADKASPVLLRFFFFLASAIWVATIVAAAPEADILPIVCRVCRGADVATLGGTLFVVGAPSSLPTNESEMYSSMCCCRAARMSAATRTL